MKTYKVTLTAEERMVVRQVFAEAKPIVDKVPGCSGDMLYHKQTKHGHIIIGGAKANRSQLNESTALVIDPGGDDVYQSGRKSAGRVTGLQRCQ